MPDILDNTQLDYMLKVVSVAKQMDINYIIIEPGKVRAIDDNRTVVILHDNNVPSMDFTSIGLTRIDEFLSRYQLVKDTKNFNVQYEIKDHVSGRYASKLIFKGTGTKVEYRCHDPSKIKVPKQINDAPAYKITISEEAIKMLSRASTAMKASKDNVTIICKDDGVSFELTDVNNDVFLHNFADKVDVLQQSTLSKKIVFRYPIKTLLSLFRNVDVKDFHIGQRGMLTYEINSLTVYILPKA